MKDFLVDDNTIIKEYTDVYDTYGETERCCQELDKLLISISSQKREEVWDNVIHGKINTIKGNMYKDKEYYKKAMHNYLGSRVLDEMSPMYLLYERNLTCSMAYDDHNMIDVTLNRLSDLADKYSDNDDILIKNQAVTCMFVKGLLLVEIKDALEESICVYDEIINKYSQNGNSNIQLIIAKCLNNKAILLERISDKNPEKGIEARNELIKKYKHTKDIKIQNQLAIALMSRSTEYMNIYLTIEAKKSFGIYTVVDSNNYAKKAKESYSELIYKYCSSSCTEILFTVALGMHNKAILLNYTGENEDSMLLYSELIEFLIENESQDFNKDDFDILLVNAMFGYSSLVEVLKGKEEATTEYKKLINRFKNHNIESILDIVVKSYYKIINDTDYDKICKEDAFNFYDEIINTYSGFSFESTKDLVDRAKSDRDFVESTYKERIQIETLLKQKDRIVELFEFYPNNERNLDELIKMIIRRKIVPFVGAGMSKFAGYPLWSEFIQSIYEKYKISKRNSIGISEKEFKTMTCVRQASFLYDVLGKAFFVREIVDTFKEKTNLDNNDLSNSSIYWLPKIFKDSLIFTTNFDKLIERVYSLYSNRHIISYTAEDVNKIDNIIQDVWVYKIHGTIDEPKSIILKQEDYLQHYDSNSSNVRLLSKYMAGKNLLFLGCGLYEDDEIATYYSNGINYAIYPCSREEIDDIEVRLSKKNIIPILFPKNDYTYIDTIFEEMSTKNTDFFCDEASKYMKMVMGIERYL